METDTESLSAEEKAYFDSRGTAEIAPETEAPEEQETETSAEVETEAEAESPEAEQQEPKRVPLAALTKERANTKELKGKLSEADKRAIEAERKAAVLEDRWNQILRAQQQEQQTQEQSGQRERPQGDPMALIDWVADQLEGMNKSRQEDKAQTEAENNRRQQMQALASLEAKFKEAQPDYEEALSFAAKSRDEELALLYPGSTAEQRQQAILGEWDNIVQAAVTAGVNPAEHVYKLAVMRGYKAPEPETQQQTAEEIEALAKAVEGSTSLSEGSGSAPVTLDAKAIADMSPDEFEAWFAKPGNQQKFKRLAGGR